MNTQERYEEISRMSGLSEDIIRRVFKASRQSLAKSLKEGERATLPGLCTIYPELKTKVEIGGTISKYIKLKANASSALATELESLNRFETESHRNDRIQQEEEGYSRLNLINPELNDYSSRIPGIRTSQISALL